MGISLRLVLAVVAGAFDVLVDLTVDDALLELDGALLTEAALEVNTALLAEETFEVELAALLVDVIALDGEEVAFEAELEADTLAVTSISV